MNSIYTTANFLLRETDYSISNLRLNRLLYYIYGVHLAMYDKRPWPEELIASSFGPIFSKLYNEFKMYGSGRIRHPLIGASFNIDEDMKSIVNEVINVFGHLADHQLSSRVHMGPWANTYVYGQEKIINENVMKEYFKENVLTYENS